MRQGHFLFHSLWYCHKYISNVLKLMSERPSLHAVKIAFPHIEHFAILMYDHASLCATINEVHKGLFTRKGISIERIPCTKDALLKHAERTVYQAGYVWGTSTEHSPTLPYANIWG